MRTLIDARQLKTIYVVIPERPYHSTGPTMATINEGQKSNEAKLQPFPEFGPAQTDELFVML
jgi:hypothetical protein